MYDDKLNLAEACAVLELDRDEAAESMLAGPFAPVAGLLDVRQVLGYAVMRSLPMLRQEDALSVALTASRDARTGWPPRLLAVGWTDAKPFGFWLSEPVSTRLAGVLLLIPVDTMLAEITARIVAQRPDTTRPN